ncbi:Gfo/Idh/MocA family protein [Geotalea toluenoxydans]|uniref:Gfo/Idh/MocA family protein n=1 Tax=Geotalea toluenoxydans TaxID=421624 RepID=UPI000A461C46|nr:hypothetical protein [Geotalea toluenoxydans]
MKKVIERGEIGRIRSLRSVFCFPCPGDGNFRLDPARGGGAFHDLARYAVSTARHFLRGRCHSFRGYALDRNGLNVAIHGTALTTAQEVFTYSLPSASHTKAAMRLSVSRGRSGWIVPIRRLPKWQTTSRSSAVAGMLHSPYHPPITSSS